MANTRRKTPSGSVRPVHESTMYSVRPVLPRASAGVTPRPNHYNLALFTLMQMISDGIILEHVLQLPESTHNGMAMDHKIASVLIVYNTKQSSYFLIFIYIFIHIWKLQIRTWPRKLNAL